MFENNIFEIIATSPKGQWVDVGVRDSGPVLLKWFMLLQAF